MLAKNIADAENVELRAWRDSPTERPGSNTVENILNKASEAQIFWERLNRFGAIFARSRRILELGAGQAWASCLVKRLFPECEVVATDLSPDAAAGMQMWPPIFGGRPEVLACRAYCTPFAASSFDLIFAFQAAHHFRRHGRTMAEIARLLRPGGAALYFHERTSSEVLYSAAYRRANRRRPDVPEDLLVVSRLRSLAAENGLTMQVRFAHTAVNQDFLPQAYYFVLKHLPFLQPLLTATADIELYKPAAS